MSSLGVVEAANLLGLSPRRVRQMLADGSLVGSRVGRAWVIESEELRRLDNGRPQVGRPWNPASAWAVLGLANGESLDLSPVERSRAKKRLALGLGPVAGRLAARADDRWFYAHPGVLGRLADDPDVVRSGVSAAVEHGADLLVGEGFEGYVQVSELDALVAQFGLDSQAGRSNVRLRVVDDSVWPFQPGQRVAGPAVVAVDLSEARDPRTRRAGADLMAGE